MTDHTIRLKIRGVDKRRSLRSEIVHKFLKEKPGKGKAEMASKYRYNVETLSGGKWLYLKRPSWMKKGFDFEIIAEGWDNGKDGRPSHSDILNDLRSKHLESRTKFRALHRMINRTYRLEDIDSILRETAAPRFQHGKPVKDLLKILKWLFIEQDITDWNYSGRAMLKGAIDSIA